MQAQISVALARLKARFAAPGAPPYRVFLNPLIVTRIGDQAMITIGVAMGILLIAASNAAALALARALTRRRDLALRVALGASRSLIAHEIVAEVAVIALFGALLGAGLAVALIGVIRRLTPEELVWQGVRLPVFTPALFAIVLGALAATIIIAGGIPAWRASHQLDPAELLTDGSSTTTARAKSEFRMLAIAELAIAMVLAMLTSLVTMSAQNLAAFEFGFDYRSLIEARVSIGFQGDTLTTKERLADYVSALAHVRAVSGVAKATSLTPSDVSGRKIISRDSFGTERTIEPNGAILDIGTDAFRTLGVTVLAGREFTDGDRVTGDAVVLAERAARMLYPRGDAVGSMLKIGGDQSKHPWMRVVGTCQRV